MSLHRRSAIASVASTLLASQLVSLSQANNLVVSSKIDRENNQEGTTDWMLSNTRVDPSTKYRCPWIEGYASHASVAVGETIEFKISTNRKARVRTDIFRIGYYAGKGGRHVSSLPVVNCRSQPVPEPGTRRLIDCQWETTHRITIPSDWVSGVYVAKLTEEVEGLQSYIIFIVKDDRPADFLFQCSDHTWQAYNRWPSQFSLYDDGKNQWHWGGSSQVSFNRPYGKYCQILDAPLSIGSGEFFLWEYPFVFWLEQEGFDVTYVSNTDLHRDGSTPLRGKGFLSVGHDEYWTIEMFRSMQHAIAGGVHVGFFSGNAVCGKIEWEKSTRSMRRVGVFGPPGGTREFDAMSSLLHERPYANELIGAHSTGPVTGGADWICSKPDHWIYANTGMKLGDRIPGVIGWEWHGDPAPIPGLEIVATGETQSAPNQPNGGIYTATVYEGPKKNIVFNAATCWWADGLSSPPGYQTPKVYTAPQGTDSRVQQMTRNVLNRMLSN